VYVQKETMNSNPLISSMNADSPDQSQEPDNDDATIQECEQKIATLEQRVSAIEKKVGLGDKQAPSPSSSSPFYG
jgi:hypothetical protein